MPISPEGVWLPEMSVKETDIFNCAARYLLASGPRRSGKTTGCCHRLIRHLWENQGPRVAIFAKTIKSAKHGGTYQKITEEYIPEWIASGMKSEFGYRPSWHTKPKTDGATRTSMFCLGNYYGTKSECYLFSLDHDDDIEAKIKNTEFSMFYFIELSNFYTRNVFTLTKASLSMMPRIPFEAHQWMADTNPSDEGEESWIYKLWYGKQQPDGEDDGFTKHLKVIEAYIEDNPYLSPEYIADLKGSYAHDQELYDRYILGKWTTANRSGHFNDVFLPNTHVQGDCSAIDKANWQIIVPISTCHELFTGWDLGDVNHSACIAQKRIVGNNATYDFIDELVCIDEQIGIDDFTEAFMEKMDYWENLIRERYKRPQIMWRHWSDDSAFNFQATISGTQQLQVARISDHRILLQGISKPRGSVRKRIDLFRRLLFENRIFISSQLVFLIKMLRSLKKGKTEAKFINRWDPLKHSLDSTSYLLAGEEPLDLSTRNEPHVEKAHQPISVPMV